MGIMTGGESLIFNNEISSGKEISFLVERSI
jgi:hypothetical protein